MASETSVPPKRREYEKGNGGLVVMKWSHIGVLVGLLAGASAVVAFAADSWVDDRVTKHKGPEPVRIRLRKLENTVTTVHENKKNLEKLDERQRRIEIQQGVAISKLDALLARPSGNGR